MSLLYASIVVGVFVQWKIVFDSFCQCWLKLVFLEIDFHALTLYSLIFLQYKHQHHQFQHDVDGKEIINYLWISYPHLSVKNYNVLHQAIAASIWQHSATSTSWSLKITWLQSEKAHWFPDRNKSIFMVSFVRVSRLRLLILPRIIFLTNPLCYIL